MDEKMKAVLDRTRFAQVGFVVENIEETAAKFALLFGCEAPKASVCGEYEVMQTTLFGEPAPLANCKLAFIDLTPGVQLELIEPNKEHSVWRDEMDRCGEGIHHIAFTVDNTDEVVKLLTENFDAVVEQHGIYGDGSGQYTYLSLHKVLKCRVELLESFNK